MTYLCGGVIFMGVVVKQFPTVPMTKVFLRDIYLEVVTTTSFLIFIFLLRKLAQSHW